MGDYPVIQIVDANGNVTGTIGTITTPSVSRLEDGTSTTLATIAQFHLGDNQIIPAANGLFTGGVAQLLNFAGNLDRARETGSDGVAAVGLPGGSMQFAMAFLTTDSTDNLAAGTRTFTPVAMSGTVQGVAWSIQVGSVLGLDSGANAETIVVTATTSTTFTCVTAKAHNGTVTPFTISGFVYNQERDASGELDGASGSGTAIAAEYEYNGGGAGSSNFDRARNLQGKGVSSAQSWTGTLTSPVTAFTSTTTPTGLQPGQPIYFYTTSTGAVTEVVYTALNYTAGSTSIVLKSGTTTTHNSATESFRYDTYTATGPGTSGMLPTGIGAEEDVLWDPVTNLFYLERSATQDGMAGANIPAVHNAVYNGTNFDRVQGNTEKSLITATGVTTTQTSATQTNSTGRGVKVILNMTNVGTGSVTLAINYKDPGSGNFIALLTGAAIITNGTTVYTVYPGLAAAANATANDVLPRTWQVVVTANLANATTYTVGSITLV